jgi:S-DNA-T family DNA segregation ATPase FtsK/SpoIIIE
LRSLLLSLLSRHSPEQLQIGLVDPKRVTFPEFEQMPWLGSPVVKDSENAIELMDELLAEMEQRYQRFEVTGCPDLATYSLPARRIPISGVAQKRSLKPVAPKNLSINI